jgi:hypothetical protein
MVDAVIVRAGDGVATLLRDGDIGDRIDTGDAVLVLSQAIPRNQPRHSPGFPVPTIKIASNTDLAQRKPGWIDFDAGQVLDQGFASAETALLDCIAAIASGRETAAERNGEREIAIWKRGVTL